MLHFSHLRQLVLLPLLLATAFQARAQNVGIGTTTPTQKLDVDGQLRVRGLSGSDTRLPLVLPDGTLGVNAPVYGTTATIPAFPTTAASSCWAWGHWGCWAWGRWPGGAGLGAMGGCVSYDSDPGAGFTVHVELPAG